MSAIPIFSLPVSFDSYIRHGWSLVPIPPGTKGPNTPGWNLKENALKDSTSIPPGYGVGLAHAYSGTCAIDIDDWDNAVTALAEHGIDLTALYTAHDAVTIDSGNPGHGKLIYAMPFGLTLPSIKVSAKGKTVYELRCATADNKTVQDLLPPSKHPSGTTYQWGGKGDWHHLPVLPVPLLSLWQERLEAKVTPSTSAPQQTYEWHTIEAAVHSINPDCSHDEWIQVGMALHTTGDSNAYDLWDNWSAEGKKYPGKRQTTARWNSFHEHPDGVKIGTLLHVAKQHGWTPPPVDVTALFATAKPLSPSQIVLGLQTPMPDIEMSLFPPVLRRRAEEVATSTGSHVLVPLWAGMAAIAGAVDARSRLELMTGFKVPPVLRVMTIGDPSEGKSPGSKPMLDPLSQLEREGLPQWKRDHLAWEALDVAYKASKKAYLDKASGADFLLSGMNTADLPPVAPEPPKEPPEPRIVVSDITSQKLARMCALRPEGLLCHLDEMLSWVAKVMDVKSGEQRSTWTESYDAGRTPVDRVGEQNAIIVENFAVSIFGNIQNKVYSKAVQAMGDDGLLQRFIPIPLPADFRPINQPIPDYLTNQTEWDALLRTVHALPITTYTLDSGAYSAYREFQQWHSETRQDERLLQSPSIFMQAFGKLTGLAGRICLVLHLATDPMNPIVNHRTMIDSLRLVRGYVIPAYRYSLYELGGDDMHALDKWLIEHIVQISGESSTVNLTQLKRSARRQLEALGGNKQAQDEAIHYAMMLLETHQYVMRLDETKRGISTWAINPQLATVHADYRTSVVKAKQRQADEMVSNLRASGHNTKRKIVRGYDPATMDAQ